MIIAARYRLGLAVLVAAVTGCTPVTAPAEAPLRLVAGSSSVTLDRHPGAGVRLDLGLRIIAGKSPFELRVTRKSYGDPIAVTQLLDGQMRSLPTNLIRNFAGLSGFLRVILTDTAGKTVLDRDQTFCPNGKAERVRRDAPDFSPYPPRCSTNPFALGGVWGIQAGWSVPTFDPLSQPVNLPDGEYIARASISKSYQDLLGITPEESSATMRVTVRTASSPGHTQWPADQSPTLAPDTARPTDSASIPNGPRPDLRSLPAGAMTITRGPSGREFLSFFATVWNAGPAPLVVDAFRSTGQVTMDAYQIFYDAKGNTLGHAPAGALEWDTRDGHNHWHLAEFARYDLLSSTRTEILRSQKTGFCLTSTDPIDLTVPNANWKPVATELHVGCGGPDMRSLREELAVGYGDTYQQSLPGQSFDITDLANGTYYVQVIANPQRRLHEANLNNNISLREAVLGGTPGARTITVRPYQLIDAK